MAVLLLLSELRLHHHFAQLIDGNVHCGKDVAEFGWDIINESQEEIEQYYYCTNYISQWFMYVYWT